MDFGMTPEEWDAYKNKLRARSEQYKNNPPKQPHPTSAGRYDERRAAWEEFYGRTGVYLHLFHWLLHNGLVHPLLGLAELARVLTQDHYPFTQLAVDLHDLSSWWLNNPGHWTPESEPYHMERAPQIPKLLSWLIHNNLVHPMIAFAPCQTTFELHDLSAKEMGVEHWV